MDAQNFQKCFPLPFLARHTGDFFKNRNKNQKSQNFFSIFLHAGTVEENTLHFEVLLLFLSLKLGADLGCSRLVHPSFDIPGDVFPLNDFRFCRHFGICCMADYCKV